MYFLPTRSMSVVQCVWIFFFVVVVKIFMVSFFYSRGFFISGSVHKNHSQDNREESGRRSGLYIQQCKQKTLSKEVSQVTVKNKQNKNNKTYKHIIFRNTSYKVLSYVLETENINQNRKRQPWLTRSSPVMAVINRRIRFSPSSNLGYPIYVMRYEGG